MENFKKVITFQQQAHYETFGADKCAKRLIAIHGYGQLSSFFIRKFRSLENHKIIAPEGLSHFYLSSTTGRIGASWMTRHERQQDILNQQAYLNAIYQSEKLDEYTPFDILGFSQGVATTCRWVVNNKIEPNIMVLWAGGIPPELTPADTSYLQNTKVIYIVGTKDPYFNAHQTMQEEDLGRKLFPNFEHRTFDGKHEIVVEILESIFLNKE